MSDFFIGLALAAIGLAAFSAFAFLAFGVFVSFTG